MLTFCLFVSFLSLFHCVPVFEHAVKQGSIKPSYIDDPSGLAASRQHPGVFYTHNDHGGRNRVFAVNPKTGDLLATLTISGARNTDWESIAVGPCTASGGSTCIYIGDQGSSAGSPANTIYKVREPANLQDQSLPVFQKLHYSWSEPQSECLMVDAAANAYVISMVDEGGSVAKLPSSGWNGPTVTLSNLTPLAIYSGHHDPLGCDISPDGKEVLLKGKVSVMYYQVVGGDVVGTLAGRPQYLPYHQEVLGEAIAWTASADGYYTLSQHHHAPFYFYKRQPEMSTVEPATNPPNTPVFGAGEMVSLVRGFELDGVSGLAGSRLHPGVYYLHNDHGDSNRIFAVDPHTGTVQATFTITGAVNQDWEDIAVGPCPGGGSCIYIADTGRSGGAPSNTIYRVKEPAQVQDTSLPLLDKLHFSWTEQDCECLMVDPNGTTYVISRATGGGQIAALPASAWSSSSATFTVGSTHRVNLHTIHHDPLACDLSVNGTEVLVKGTSDVFYYRVGADGDVVGAVQGPSARMPYTQEELGEAIAWTPSAQGYYTVSQGHFLPFYYYKRQ